MYICFSLILKKKKKRFLVSLKYVRKARSREKFFSPSFETTLLVHPTCLEKAKEERGVSSPLSLRTMLVHKSRSRGRSVRAILGGLKLLGREQSANRSNTQIQGGLSPFVRHTSLPSSSCTRKLAGIKKRISSGKHMSNFSRCIVFCILCMLCY